MIKRVLNNHSIRFCTYDSEIIVEDVLDALEEEGMKPPSKGYIPSSSKIDNLNKHLSSFTWESEDD